MLLFTPVSTTLPRDTDDADFVSNNTNSFRGVKNMNEQKNTTKTQIKQAAIRQIEKFGIDKTSMRSIAAEANMTTAEASFRTPYKLRAGLLLQSEKKLRFFHDISGKPTLGSEEVIPRLPSFSPKYILSSSYSSRCTYIKISLISSICFSIVIMITLSPT